MENQTINSSKYCTQLDQMKAALHKKHPELDKRKRIIFHQDNARSHVSLMTRQKLLQLGCEVLIHLPYSPDIIPSDFHLFRSLQNSLSGKNFNSLELKRHLEQFFAQKDKKFWEDGIMKLPEKIGRRQWNKTVNMLFNKVLGENEKCVFYFYLKKPKALFGSPNTMLTLVKRKVGYLY